MKQIEHELLASASARAERLKRVRKMTRLSRRAFAEKHSISSGTLQNWETARFGGVTEKGARTVLKALRQESVLCSYQWLMLGVGDGPVAQQRECRQETTVKMGLQTTSIEQECAFLKTEYANICIHAMRDNSMLPYLAYGSVVAGEPVDLNGLDSTVGKMCILKTLDGVEMVRFVRMVHADQQISCFAANMFSEAKNLFAEHISVTAVAIVSWIRHVQVK